MPARSVTTSPSCSGAPQCTPACETSSTSARCTVRKHSSAGGQPGRCRSSSSPPPTVYGLRDTRCSGASRVSRAHSNAGVAAVGGVVTTRNCLPHREITAPAATVAWLLSGGAVDRDRRALEQHQLDAAVGGAKQELVAAHPRVGDHDLAVRAAPDEQRARADRHAPFAALKPVLQLRFVAATGHGRSVAQRLSPTGSIVGRSRAGPPPPARCAHPSLCALALALGCVRDDWRYVPRDAGRDVSDVTVAHGARRRHGRRHGRRVDDLTGGATAPHRAGDHLRAARRRLRLRRGAGRRELRGRGARRTAESSCGCPGLDGAAEITPGLVEPRDGLPRARRGGRGAVQAQGALDPIAVRDLDDARQIAGRCAVRASGAVACWGSTTCARWPCPSPTCRASRASTTCTARCAATARWRAGARWALVLDPAVSARVSATPEEVPWITSAVSIAVGPRSRVRLAGPGQRGLLRAAQRVSARRRRERRPHGGRGRQRRAHAEHQRAGCAPTVG